MRPCSIVIYRKFYLCCFYHFRLFSGFLNCTNLVYNLCITFWKSKINKPCLYCSIFTTDINRKIILNCLYYLSYYCWSVTYISRVSKFHNFFWHAQKLGQGLYLRAFIIVIYGKFISNSLARFSALFHLVCKLLKSLF